MKIQWTRGVGGGDGVRSKDGRFDFFPEYIGTTRPQGYQYHDNKTGRKGSADTQRQAKRECQKIIDQESA